MTNSTLLLKRSLKSAAGFARLHGGRSASPNASVTIFAYHRVVADIVKAEQEAIYGLVISRQTFRRHCESIRAAYDVVPLEAVPAIINGSHRTDRPAAAITFDDGYRDFYDEAFPVLNEFGLPATVFLPTASIGGSIPLAHDRVFWLLKLAQASSVPIRHPSKHRYSTSRSLLSLTDQFVYLPREEREEIIDGLQRSLAGQFAGYPLEYELLDWDMVRELSAKGISFGSHTSNHVVLTLEDAAVARKELAESKYELETRVGAPVATFAYPNGKYDKSVKAAAAEAGYKIAVTTENRINTAGADLLALGRTSLCEESTRGIAGRYSARVAALRLGA